MRGAKGRIEPRRTQRAQSYMGFLGDLGVLRGKNAIEPDFPNGLLVNVFVTNGGA